MAIGEFQSESFGTCSLPSLPEDVFAVISRSLSPSDICNLSFCCKSLCALVGSEEIWLAQCELVKVLPLSEVLQWRTRISSYKALCRFLVEVMKPLVGIWVHQSPELGNVVYVMPGYLSVVGCRIIPQKVGPLGIQEGRVMWSPVFEIICGFDGSSKFFLHGRNVEGSCVYPGFVAGIEKSCNVLHLEVEPRREKSLCSENENESEEVSRKVSFRELTLSDKKNLLNLVTSQVSLHVPEPLAGRLFPTPKDEERMLSERRTMLLKMHKFGGNWKHKNLEEEEEQLCYNPMKVDIDRILKTLANDNKDIDSDDDDDDDDGDDGDDGDDDDDRESSKEENFESFFSAGDTFGLSLKASYTEISSYIGWPIMSLNHFSLYKLPIKNPVDTQDYAGLCELQSTKRKSFSQVFRSGIKHILRRSSSKKASTSSEIRRSNQKTFLSSGDVVGLSVKATKTKLPIKKPVERQEYAGLWGGTFGWPPGRFSEDKPGKAMFLLMLGYEETQKDNSIERLLIGTKILEGTGHVGHPNGSNMFVVNIDAPSLEPFPFDAEGREFEHSYKGDGIASGYGFRYPSSKPGSLYVISDDLLVFVWQETRDVCTLQRLNLEEMLKQGLGLCVPPLPPTKNFTYMERSYRNVYLESYSPPSD